MAVAGVAPGRHLYDTPTDDEDDAWAGAAIAGGPSRGRSNGGVFPPTLGGTPPPFLTAADQPLSCATWTGIAGVLLLGVLAAMVIAAGTPFAATPTDGSDAAAAAAAAAASKRSLAARGAIAFGLYLSALAPAAAVAALIVYRLRDAGVSKNWLAGQVAVGAGPAFAAVFVIEALLGGGLVVALFSAELRRILALLGDIKEQGRWGKVVAVVVAAWARPVARRGVEVVRAGGWGGGWRAASRWGVLVAAAVDTSRLWGSQGGEGATAATTAAAAAAVATAATSVAVAGQPPSSTLLSLGTRISPLATLSASVAAATATNTTTAAAATTAAARNSSSVVPGGLLSDLPALDGLDSPTATALVELFEGIPKWKWVAFYALTAFVVAGTTEEAAKLIIARRYRALLDDGIRVRGIVAGAAAGALGLATMEHAMFVIGLAGTGGALAAAAGGAARALLAFPLHVGTGLWLGSVLAGRVVRGSLGGGGSGGLGGRGSVAPALGDADTDDAGGDGSGLRGALKALAGPVAVHGAFDFNAMIAPLLVLWMGVPTAAVALVPLVDIALIGWLAIVVTRAYRAAVQAEAAVYMAPPISPV